MKQFSLLGCALLVSAIFSFGGPPPPCSDSYATINKSVCNTYTSPSGKTWTTSNTYLDTIPNLAGCDSVMTIHLTVSTGSPVYVVSTLAGAGSIGNTDGTGTSARFNYPRHVALDSAGNVYASDYFGGRIRKITPFGVVSTINVALNKPSGVVVDSSGNIYVAEYVSSHIVKISPSGTKTTLAGSGTSGFVNDTGTSAQFYRPDGIALDGNGNVYVADYGNNCIRKISPSGVVTTLAGSGTAGFADGTGTTAQFYRPTDVAVDGAGNVYVADQGNNRIRKITPSGVVTTIAGSASTGFVDGTGTSAKFADPSGLAIDGDGNLYIADADNYCIRKMTPSGVVTTIVGTNVQGYKDGTGTSARFNNFVKVAVDKDNNLYIPDIYNQRIRKVTVVPGSGETKDTISVTTCNSYTSPSGKTWTTSNTYLDTIPNDAGCDSVITINLTVNRRLCVDAGMTSSGTGGSWGTSFKTLKEALDSVNNIVGFEERIQIWVKSGV